MTRDHSAADSHRKSQDFPRCQPNHYQLLDLAFSASGEEIRQAYRQKSKLYHPDTTTLPAKTATEKFRSLNEAYATLSNSRQRLLYDRSLGLGSCIEVSPELASLNANGNGSGHRSPVILDPRERPLSAGELFALLILGLTFTACLVLAIVVGLTRGETFLQNAQVSPLGRTVSPSYLRSKIMFCQPRRP